MAKVVGPSDFSQQVDLIEHDGFLSEDNLFEVKLTSVSNSLITPLELDELEVDSFHSEGLIFHIVC